MKHVLRGPDRWAEFDRLAGSLTEDEMIVSIAVGGYVLTPYPDVVVTVMRRPQTEEDKY